MCLYFVQWLHLLIKLCGSRTGQQRLASWCVCVVNVTRVAQLHLLLLLLLRLTVLTITTMPSSVWPFWSLARTCSLWGKWKAPIENNFSVSFQSAATFETQSGKSKWNDKMLVPNRAAWACHCSAGSHSLPSVAPLVSSFIVALLYDWKKWLFWPLFHSVVLMAGVNAFLFSFSVWVVGESVQPL